MPKKYEFNFLINKKSQINKSGFSQIYKIYNA